MSRIRVLLVGENADFLRGASDWLVSESNVDFVGAAASGAEAIDLAGRLEPDVVVMDESVSDMKTPEVVRRVKSLRTAPRVVLLSFLDGGATRQIAAATGADGVVAKARFTAALLPAIYEVLGGSSLPPARGSVRSKSTLPISTKDEITRSES